MPQALMSMNIFLEYIQENTGLENLVLETKKSIYVHQKVTLIYVICIFHLLIYLGIFGIELV